MPITRAFTTRRVKQSLILAERDVIPQRSNTTKGSISSIRHKISAPVELIHTTNLQSYNAPDIVPKTASSPGSSHRSDDDLSDSAPTNASSPPTSPDVDTSPTRSLSPEPNHLSCYFTVPGQTIEQAISQEPPSVPRRAISHTQKSHGSLVRQRSASQMSEHSQRSLSTKASFTFSRSSSTSTSTSTSTRTSTRASTNTTATSHSSAPSQHKAKVSGSLTMPSHPSFTTSSRQASSLPQQPEYRKDFVPSQHPFGHELAQVTEIAEEYGVKEQLSESDVERQELVAKGLHKFSAEDYLSEIQGLLSGFLGEIKPIVTTRWI